MQTETRVSLVEKYRPRRIADFIGHEKIKKILSAYVANPYPTAFLFSGPPGAGKTSMGQAMSYEMGAEFHHLVARQCGFDVLTNLCNSCWDVPIFASAHKGRKYAMHFVLIDEVDEITGTAQTLFLSKLDSTQRPPNTIFVFTSNDPGKLEPRFVSRCIRLDFNSYGEIGNIKIEIEKFLDKVWHAEGGNGNAPNWKGVVRERGMNIRDCLLYLETELLTRG